MKVKLKLPTKTQVVELDTNKRYLFIFSGDQTSLESVTHLTNALTNDGINAIGYWIDTGNPQDVKVIDLENPTV